MKVLLHSAIFFSQQNSEQQLQITQAEYFTEHSLLPTQWKCYVTVDIFCVVSSY